MTIRRLGPALLGIGVLMAGAACAPAMTPTPTTTSPSMTPSVSLTPSEDQSLAKAKNAVVHFQATVDELGIDPNMSINSLATVARGDALSSYQVILTKNRSLGVQQVGRSLVQDLRAVYKGSNTYQVNACLDVSQRDFVDSSGKSVVKPGGPRRVQIEDTVAQASDSRFYVTKHKVGAPC